MAVRAVTITQTDCPKCGQRVPVKVGDLRRTDIRTLDDLVAAAQRFAETACPVHWVAVIGDVGT